MKIGIGQAHGKIILIGEHAVVYGKKAISLPFFATKVAVEVKKFKHNEISSIVYNGILDNSPIELEAISSLIKELSKKLGLPNLHYKIESNIPISAGMGSSAATSASIIEAVYDYLDLELTLEEQYNWTQFSEKIAHGNPSGIDALTTINDKAWLFQKGEKPIEFSSKLNAYLVVGQTGERGNTKEAVTKVRRLVDKENKMFLIDKIGADVGFAYDAYMNQDVKLLATLLNNTQIKLKELNISTEKIDTMVKLALENSALAAKLTGGGLGGCVIALVKDENEALKVKKVWEDYSNLQAWVLNLNGENQ